MAKYSTGGVGGESSDACELCGAEERQLRTATVAGARLEVCDDCARHGDEESSTDDTAEERKRRKRAAQNVARLGDAQKVETDWVEKTDYDDDQLPYLVSGYGDRVETARQEIGLQPDELAAELGIEQADLLAVEQGRAPRAGVGGSVIRALEERLNVELVDE